MGNGGPAGEAEAKAKEAEAKEAEAKEAEAKAQEEAKAKEEAEDDEAGVPISKARVEYCLKSARFWVKALPRFADDQQRTADRWALAAGVLSAVTSLAIWPAIESQANRSESNGTIVDPLNPFAIAISVVAFAAAICALFPRVKNYSENAGQAREVASRYGAVLGDLMDLDAMDPFDQRGARAVVRDFEAIKQQKDGIRGLPSRERVEAKEAIAAAQDRADVANAERGVVTATK